MSVAHARDLALAQASVAGDADAIQRIDSAIVPAIVQTLARRDLARYTDEVVQRVRVQLFTSVDDRPPEIVDYTGRGPLRAWAAVMAMRIAFKLAQRDGREVASENNSLFDAVTDSDPESALIRQTYSTELRTAFFEAIGQTPPDDRVLLRAHLLEHASIDALAAELEIHRSTAARRLAGARQNLLERTKATLAHNLGLPASQLDSIIELVRSRLDLSLDRVL